MDNDSLGYVCCPAENRSALLVELLTKSWNRHDRCWTKKAILVFSHDNCIRFYTELVNRLHQMPIMPVLTENLIAKDGLQDYKVFQSAETGVLAVSRSVVTQLENLNADLLIQYDPPESADFVSQLCRVASSYLLFLRPQEVGFIKHLSKKGLQLQERFVPWDHIPSMPKQKLQLWYKTYHSMNLNSKAAYKAYMDAIRDHKQPKYFNLNGVLIKEMAEGFCFAVPPYYKLVNERPRYELDRERKALRAAEELPATAKRITTQYKRIVKKTDSDPEALRIKELARKNKLKAKLNKRRRLNDDDVVRDEEGIVQLGRDRKHDDAPSRKKKKAIQASKADVRALKKQVLHIPGVRRTSKRPGYKRRRPLK